MKRRWQGMGWIHFADAECICYHVFQACMIFLDTTLELDVFTSLNHEKTLKSVALTCEAICSVGLSSVL
jgi:hypothetical protein